MASPTLTPNKKPAAATIRDRLNLVLATTRTHSGKDIRNVCIYSPAP